MIGIVSYGLGNIAAFATMYRRLGIPAGIVTTPAEVRAASRLVLPGVGAFDWAMRRLNESGMRDALDEQVCARGVPVLGVCVGMQMMACRSAEGTLDGLGWLPGTVESLHGRDSGGRLNVPHMGWNDVSPSNGAGLFRGLESGARFYFLHSYFFVPSDSRDIAAVAEYGGPFVCSVHARNVYGVQFHPEKSHGWGVELLKNFAGCSPC